MQWFVVVYDRETRKALHLEEFGENDDAKVKEAYVGYLVKFVLHFGGKGVRNVFRKILLDE